MNNDKKRIIKIARHQNIICWLCITGLFGLSFRTVGLIVGIIAIFQVYFLAESLELKHPWVYAIGMFVPFISIFILWKLIRLATKTLREHNIRVGLMGAKKRRPSQAY